MIAFFEQLWNGNITPYQNCGRGDQEVEELAGLIERHKTALDNVLDDEQKSILEKYITCCNEYRYLTAVHAFREGFCLASKLLTEALAEK